MQNLEWVMLIVAFLALTSVLASKISDKFGIPVLFIFLGIGMLAGSDGLLGIAFDNPLLAQGVGTVALIFILYGGGLDTVWGEVRLVLKEGLLLSTFGVILTAFLVSVAVYAIVDVTPLEALLVGTIISSTDAAAVFAIFRAKGIAIRKRLGSLLELESGSNDPMAIFLTLTILQLIVLKQESGVGTLLLDFFLQFGIGALLGYLFGAVLPPLFNRIHLGYTGLYPILSVGWMLMLFALSSMLHGNGFLAVYIAGIVINRFEFVHKKNLVAFHDAVAWIMQILVFLTLGLLVFPSALPEVALKAFALALFLMLVARPVGVLLTLAMSRIPMREKLFTSWVGLRGAVPIILATYPFVYELEHADMIFNTVFFMVLTSVLLQGTTLPYVARWLKVERHEAAHGERSDMPLIRQSLQQYLLPYGAKSDAKALAEINLDPEFLVLLIEREGKYIKPTGSTMLYSGDILLIHSTTPEHYEKGIAQLV